MTLPFAPLYYAYGLSLLQHSITQSSILGDAVPEGTQSAQHNGSVAAEEEAEEDGKRAELANGQNKGADNADLTEALIARQGAMVEQTMALIDDLQVAWEVLDMARVIYEKGLANTTNTTENSLLALKLANVHLALGDVSMESDSFESAADEFHHALNLRRANLASDDRAISEVLFKIGVAYEMAGRMTDAATFMQEAITVLRHRKELVTKKLNDAQLSSQDLANMEQDIADLEMLLPDLELKVTPSMNSLSLLLSFFVVGRIGKD
jgi:HAT1-interacting factor 1